MHRSTFRLSRPLKAAVYLSFGVLLTTGGAWMFAQRHLGEDSWERIPRSVMQIHGAAAMAALLVLGALTPHVKRGWQAHKNRLSGVLLIALNIFLVVTGYGLYYAGDEDFRSWLSRWHAWIGLSTLILFPAHIVVGRLVMRQFYQKK